MQSPSFGNKSPSTRRSLPGGVFSLSLLEERNGIVVLQAEGDKAKETFRNEGGGHRWQRIPPNEKRGRVHTSTVTVAVLREPEVSEVVINDRDLEWQAIRGSGAGGQARNKTSNAVILKHRPSGLMVRVETERSLEQNKRSALASLRARLLSEKETTATNDENNARRGQVGSGMRGDKRRTYRSQDDTVSDHVLGTKARLSRILDGYLEDLT